MLLLSACAPPPTPVPVTPVITQEATLTPSGESVPVATLAPIRYGILPNAADYAPVDQLQSNRVQVSTVTELGEATEYDVQVGFGTVDGWEAVSVELSPVTLTLDTSRPPFNMPALADIVAQAVQADAIVTSANIPGMQSLTTTTDTSPTRQQTRLANAGYPDGISVYGRMDNLPGIASVLDQLRAANITVTPTETPNAHLHIGRQANAPASDVRVIDLYTLPMSYTARDDVLITFLESGWVIAAREDT